MYYLVEGIMGNIHVSSGADVVSESDYSTALAIFMLNVKKA